MKGSCSTSASELDRVRSERVVFSHVVANIKLEWTSDRQRINYTLFFPEASESLLPSSHLLYPFWAMERFALNSLRISSVNCLRKVHSIHTIYTKFKLLPLAKPWNNKARDKPFWTCGCRIVVTMQLRPSSRCVRTSDTV